MRVALDHDPVGAPSWRPAPSGGGRGCVAVIVIVSYLFSSSSSSTTTTSNYLSRRYSRASRSIPMIGPVRRVAYEQEQDHGDSPKGDELGMAAGHAVAFAARLVDARGPFLLDEALEGEIDGLAGELAGKEEHDFGLARRPDECGVDDAEGLRHEGEPGTEVGDGVGGVLLEAATEEEEEVSLLIAFLCMRKRGGSAAGDRVGVLTLSRKKNHKLTTALRQEVACVRHLTYIVDVGE